MVRLSSSRIGMAALAAALASMTPGVDATPGDPRRSAGDPAKVIDLADLTAGVDPLTRVSGSGSGQFFSLGVLGVPVAGGVDVDGDGHEDFAVAHFLDSPQGRPLAGQVDLVFGAGVIGEAFELNTVEPRILAIHGAGENGVLEASGSEIWMGDVTGDGLGDLLICRQNFSPAPGGDFRPGAGALTILSGDPALRQLAADGTIVDLAAPPAAATLFTIVGPSAHARLGIWARVGDVDGDGTSDLVVAADQESSPVENHHGAVYVVRGGSHLAADQTVDLAEFGATALAGNIARITPPAGADEFHLGATNQVGDLDGNGRAEVYAAAALNRAGAILGPFGVDFAVTHGAGGAGGGRLYIIWDDNFPDGPWPDGFHVDLSLPPGSVTAISGGAQNITFGEEVLGGLDYDGDCHADLFVGDLVGDGTELQDRPVSGIGYVFYRAERLKGLEFNVDAVPPQLELSKLLGPEPEAIGSDTATHGDFDGDGFADLLIGSPTASPKGRFEAGVMHVLFGRHGRWPALIDTALGAFPAASEVRVAEIQGALGPFGESDSGDTLCYSAAAGDVDGDGRTDVITNEMRGDGIDPIAIDVGNLIVLRGPDLAPPGGASSANSCAVAF